MDKIPARRNREVLSGPALLAEQRACLVPGTTGVESLEISRRVGMGGVLWILQYGGSLGTRLVPKKGGGREL